MIVVLVATALGALYLTAWGTIENYLKNRNGTQSLEAIEKRIAAGDKSADTLQRYGDALMDAGKFDNAASAFRQVLVLQPLNRSAKFQQSVALAMAKKSEDLHACLKKLVYTDPKMAIEIFDRPELKSYLQENRFAALQREAQQQALD